MLSNSIQDTLHNEMKVLIFEDNLLLQDSLAEILISEGYAVLGKYENAKHLLRVYEQLQPDIIIMDIDMPEVDGLQGLKELKSKHPEAKVVIFTVFEDNDKVLNAICLGANGYILKSSSEDKIIEALVDVANGGSPLTPIIASKILLNFPKKNLVNNYGDEALSEKEKEVLELMVKGYSYKMIGYELNKSVETIRSQIKNIYKKLNVSSNSEAIIKTLKSRS